MEYGTDRDDEMHDDAGSRDEVATPVEPSGPPTGGVRIIGAETAADITSEMPIVPPAHIEPAGPDAGLSASVRIIDEPVSVDSAEPANDLSDTASHAELPHWTEPATGQVPAVLSRDDAGTGTVSGVLPPTWREGDADWTAHEEEFEPAMFSDERASLGALDETDDTDEERRPWEFDLDSVRPGQPGPGGSSDADPITEPVAVVRTGADADAPLFEGHVPVGSGSSGSTGLGSPDVDVAGLAATAAVVSGPGDVVSGPGDEVSDQSASAELASDALASSEGVRPSGTPRVGRASRSGLIPGRLKAKRPGEAEGVTGDPTAADLPGASVADVPGAGRRRTGLAEMAANDRIAGEELEDASSMAAVAPSDDTGTDSGTVPASRRHRRSGKSGDRPLRSSSNYVPDVTGGGPPPPVAASRVHKRDAQVPVGSTGLRVGTGVAVAFIALLAFKLGTVTALILCLLVVTFAAGEAFAVLRKAGWRPATLLGLVGTISLMIGAYDKGIAALPLVIVLITVFTLLWFLFGVERGSAVAGTAATLLVIGWVGLLGSYAGLLLAPGTFPNRHGIAFLVGAIIATVANDVGALVVGRWIGSRQLAPNISPNKTWEGLAGGALASILVSTIVVGAIHPWSAATAALLGVVVAVVAPLGDLCESLLKRDLRLKDMGTMLPGHGGVLDRVDALIFVLPATYYLVRALNIA